MTARDFKRGAFCRPSLCAVEDQSKFLPFDGESCTRVEYFADQENEQRSALTGTSEGSSTVAFCGDCQASSLRSFASWYSSSDSHVST